MINGSYVIPLEVFYKDMLLLRTLLDRLFAGLYGPFEVVAVRKKAWIFWRASDVYMIAGVDRLQCFEFSFTDKHLATDICNALNRIYGFAHILVPYGCAQQPTLAKYPIAALEGASG
ncbi:MAG TPA: hypothetical protein VMV94_10055 [Phycisphaerae bacterium]|nr:hypothetical protein [Phycisphaerae bacterium]